MWIKLETLLSNQKTRFRGDIENAQLPALFTKTIQNIHPHAAEYVEYHNIHKDTLYVQVSDSIWIGELALYKENIKKELNKGRDKPIKNIKFTLA